MEYIYGLVESGKPVSEIKYVGRTDNPKSRLSNHRHENDGTKKSNWVQSLKKMGKTVDMIILHTIDDKNKIVSTEKGWIAFAKSKSWGIENSITFGQKHDCYSFELNEMIEACEYVSMIVDDYNARIAKHSAMMSKLIDEKHELALKVIRLQYEMNRREIENKYQEKTSATETEKQHKESLLRLEKENIRLKNELADAKSTILMFKSVTGYDVDRLIMSMLIFIMAVVITGAATHTSNPFLNVASIGLWACFITTSYSNLKQVVFSVKSILKEIAAVVA